MKVSELIEELKDCPPDNTVTISVDGRSTRVEVISTYGAVTRLSGTENKERPHPESFTKSLLRYYYG